MKRHPSLALLSREHHEALILAQLMKAGAAEYRGLPTELGEKAEYASVFYHEHLSNHFRREEQSVIKRITGIDGHLDALAGEILEEHKVLRDMFASIQHSKDLLVDLDNLGITFEKHIRKEERIFFPLIESLCSETTLREMETVMSAT